VSPVGIIVTILVVLLLLGAAPLRGSFGYGFGWYGISPIALVLIIVLVLILLGRL
jgi:bacteriorhodopsin